MKNNNELGGAIATILDLIFGGGCNK